MMYAVRFRNVWSIAKKSEPSEYNLEELYAGKTLWSDPYTTALIGVVGEEEEAVQLERHVDPSQIERRCKSGVVDGDGSCLACDAAQGEICRFQEEEE